MKTKTNKSAEQATKSNKTKHQKDFTTALNTLIENIEEWCTYSPFGFYLGSIPNDEDTMRPLEELFCPDVVINRETLNQAFEKLTDEGAQAKCEDAFISLEHDFYFFGTRLLFLWNTTWKRSICIQGFYSAPHSKAQAKRNSNDSAKLGAGASDPTHAQAPVFGLAPVFFLSPSCDKDRFYNAASLILLRSYSSAGRKPERGRLTSRVKGVLLMPTAYKGHTLVAGAARGQISDHYLPTVYISWEIAGVRNTFTPSFNEHFPTFDEATDFALAVAKAWVDRHAEEID